MINRNILLDLGFTSSIVNGCEIFSLYDYSLKSELGKWLIMGLHSGDLVTGLGVISTIDELKKHFFESTGKKLA